MFTSCRSFRAGGSLAEIGRCRRGCGHVGLPLSIAFAPHHRVVIYDIDSQAVARVQRGEVPFKDEGAEEGFTSKETVNDVSELGVTLYGPSGQRKWKSDPYEIGSNDSEAVRKWKERMATPEAQEIYKERGATAETVNADLRTWRALDRFLVRGKRKTLCVVLWNVLAYNMLRYFALTATA